MRPLNILHVMRAPVGGLFRHVVDLTHEQIARGHAVGIVADSSTGDARTEAVLADLAPLLALGLTRLPMSRHIGLSDIAASRAAARMVRAQDVDVVHGHGAKGGAYARLTARSRNIRVYTPHGGSLHYSRRSPLGLLYLTLERALMPRTELFLFESAYGRSAFESRVGRPDVATVVHNGVAEDEFVPVTQAADATDLLFIGELRELKGVDVLIDAFGLLAQKQRKVSLTIVGDGPDAASFRARASALGSNQIIFRGAMPARAAFALGRVLVVPSRAESLPYIVLEAAAAKLPIITTAVGGIPEIFGPDADRLVRAGDPHALASAIAEVLDDAAAAGGRAAALQARVRERFSVDAMTTSVLAAYARALGEPLG